MAKSKNDGADKEPIEPRDLGYGKPPKDKQFQKGRSGNPSGRPKKDVMFKSVSRMIRDCLLEEVEVSINGKKRKMLRLEAIIAKQQINALQGNIQSTKLLLSLADKHIPTHLSLMELMDGRPVFEFTKEDVERFSHANLIKGMKGEEPEESPDEQPVL